MKEHSSNEVVLHEVDPAAIELLIEYAYTGQIIITPDNVQVLLPASSVLQMQNVREACCKFLLKQLHPTNCLGIRSFAGKKVYKLFPSGSLAIHNDRSPAKTFALLRTRKLWIDCIHPSCFFQGRLRNYFDNENVTNIKVMVVYDVQK